ncbi:MAG: ThuA domain-containing protein [Acidimicrobiales bacterium]
MRNVLFTGGWAHDFATHAPLLSAALDGAGVGIETTMVDDLDTLAEVVRDGVDLVTIYACRFRMLDERYTPEQRAEWSMEIPASTRAALTDHVAAGRPMLAVHTAAVCFDDWPEWSELLGGGWSWERSWHPPPENMTVRLVGDHPIVAGFDVSGTGTPAGVDAPGGPDDRAVSQQGSAAEGSMEMASIRIVDERYTDLVVHETSQVLAVCAGDDGVDQPVLWCHESAGGRVVYDSLGHDVRSLTHPGHLELIARSVRWLVADEA